MGRPSIIIDDSLCIGCGDCQKRCEHGAIKLIEGKAVIDETHCDKLGACIGSCPNGAISFLDTDKSWPIKLRLVPKSRLKNSDVLIAADCVGFMSDFVRKNQHQHILLTCCPKFDHNFKVQLRESISEVKNIKVVIMDVPCCKGLVAAVADIRGVVPETIIVNQKGESNVM